MKLGSTARPVLLCGLAALLCSACVEAEQPAYFEVVQLEGDAYERGFQHGERLGSKIRSLYTLLLESALLPYLNREQNDVADFLPEYRRDLYSDGQFSYQLLIQSGRALAAEMETESPAMLSELHGLADGSGMPFDHILILNTFPDTMLAFRAMTLYIKLYQAPRIEQVEARSGDDGLALQSDGIDNNGDGRVDDTRDHRVRDWREGLGLQNAYGASDHAVLVEVPTDASLVLRLHDPPSFAALLGQADEVGKLGERQGVDPQSIRIQLDDTVYRSERDDCVQVQPVPNDSTRVDVVFTPPGGFRPASVVSVIVSAGNLSELTEIPPVHARLMRDERFVITTEGSGLAPTEVDNLGAWDGRSQPPALGVGVRRSATPDGRTRLAHHFALIDANVAHKHGVLFVHHPDEGIPHATLGWAGLVGGFSGMNAQGLTWMGANSDTLNNSLTGQVDTDGFDALIRATGVPILVQGRRLLRDHGDVGSALSWLEQQPQTNGWNLLLGDAEGELAVVELTSDIKDDGTRFTAFGPGDDGGDTPPDVRRLTDCSAGPDDLRFASHYQRKLPDAKGLVMVFEMKPQRYWSSFWFRSLRAHLMLGEQIARLQGKLDTPTLAGVLSSPGLVDTRDSMNAVIWEPETLQAHIAAGQVPATDGPFVPYELRDALTGGQP